MPTPDETIARIQRELDTLARQTQNQAIRDFIAQLQELRKAIRSEILAGPDPFSAPYLKQTQEHLETLIKRFEAAATQSMHSALTRSYQIGASAAIQPLIEIGLTDLATTFTAQDLQFVLDYSANLIQSITNQMRDQINTQLRLAQLAGKTPFEVMTEITKILGIKARDGVWGLRRRPEVVQGLAARAEAIFRTEMTRISNMSKMKELEALGQRLPALKPRKWWDATEDKRTRASHRAVQRATQDDPIPLDKPFLVGGYEMMHPGDPAGPAKETVNCRCRMRIVYPEIEDVIDEVLPRATRR